jgi:hypothetical protein
MSETSFEVIPSVSELEVSAWQSNDVQNWVRYYGFYDAQVLSNIIKFSICGSHLLTAGITGEEIGIRSRIGVTMFYIRICELKERDLKEKAQHDVDTVGSLNNVCKRRRTSDQEALINVKRDFNEQLIDEEEEEEEEDDDDVR